MWQLRGKRGRFGTCRVHSPTANNSGNSLIRTRPLGLLKPLSANQANVESSYKTNHSSDQFLQNRPPKNQVKKYVNIFLEIIYSSSCMAGAKKTNTNILTGNRSYQFNFSL
jgi:hypothetical protein